MDRLLACRQEITSGSEPRIMLWVGENPVQSSTWVSPNVVDPDLYHFSGSGSVPRVS